MRNSNRRLKLFCVTVWLISLIYFFNVKESRAAEIRRLSVPRWIRNGTAESVVLDCDYVYNENDLRLVVKWFFEDNFEPVYQWIPALNLKHTSGILKNRLDLNFSVKTVDLYSKYRALRILQPSIELSGKYTCLVTSLAGQDSKEQIMTVFVPAEDFELGYREIREGAVNVSCGAWGVFPFPQLRLILHSSTGSSPHVVNTATYRKHLKPSGAYDILMHRVFTLLELSTRGITVFECSLDLPGTNYTRSKRIAYFADTQGQKISSPHSLSSSSVNHNFFPECKFCFYIKCSLLVTYFYFTLAMRKA